MTSTPLFPHRHLLGIAGLQPHEISYLLDEAEQWVSLNRSLTKHDNRLPGARRSTLSLKTARAPC